jgi:hypothetical protein
MEKVEKHSEIVKREADQIIRQIDIATVCREIDLAITYYWTGRDEYLDLQTRADHLEAAFNILENENYHTEAEKVARVLWQAQSQLKAEQALNKLREKVAK